MEHSPGSGVGMGGLGGLVGGNVLEIPYVPLQKTFRMKKGMITSALGNNFYSLDYVIFKILSILISNTILFTQKNMNLLSNENEIL